MFSVLLYSLDFLVAGLLRIKGMKRLLKYFIFDSADQRRLLLFLIDTAIIWVSLYGSLLLRLDTQLTSPREQLYLHSVLVFTLFKMGCFYVAGMYRPLLRHSGLELIESPIKAMLWSDGLLLLLSFGFQVTVLPRSVQIISAFISLVLIITSRLLLRRVLYRIDLFASRAKQDQQSSLFMFRTQPTTQRVIIYGAGQAGMLLAHSIQRSHDYAIVAFVDDQPELAGRIAQDITIYHSSDIDKLILDGDVNLILLALPSAQPQERQQILQRLQPFAIEVKTVPTLEEIVSGQIAITSMREVDIADLLGRAEVQPQPDLLRANITDQAVLVTGAGGSIGAELCRQIAQQKPSLLVLYELNEFALYSIELELTETAPELNCVACLGSVTDVDRLRHVITTYSIDTIYHAAAYKHVPLVEANPAQGVLNNAYGTLIAAQIANESKVNTFVLISTDKAVRPTNIMGATKRVSELILQAFAAQPIGHTRFVMVRFGNVLGSSGSVIPRFRQQIAERKPITITHPEITRYFMSIPEAARLVIQAGAMGEGGEVFLLNMGEPVKIYDLAVQMIEFSGLKPHSDIPIQITGLRPGEKLYEELLIDPNSTLTTAHPKIFAAKEVMIPWERLQPLLEELFTQAEQGKNQLIKPILKKLVAGYQPASERHPTPSIPQLDRFYQEQPELPLSWS
ncbi:MAG: hypothetical protein RLZZ511_1202 [Cyanobacteriota bacterium]|jgi:FlaA1/EpsC-like NDP-sugar epimerase